MPTLTESWPHFKRLLANGVNLIPVRDKDDDRGKRKVAYSTWKEFQERFNTEENLWREMDAHSTTAAAIVCGKVSGNLEIIDIDVKYRPGIDAQFFSDVKSLYPELFEKLRLHKTPSGGFHILYRIKDQSPEGNKKLSSRAATEEELSTHPKVKSYCFLETRGEGGYALTPPSLGYLAFNDVPIPTITWEERCSLISLASMYNEVIKAEKPHEPTKAESGYYTENPFEDFNNRVDAVTLLEGYGWTYVKSNAKYDMFTRPGGKKGDVHGGFIKDRRLFYVFTTSTEFENERAYQPSSVMSVYEHAGDRKQTYKKLVELGFGKIRPGREQALIEKGKELPSNASPEARQYQEEYNRKMSDTYPHGLFWEWADNGESIIDRNGFMEVAAGLGYRWYENKLHKIIGRFVHLVDDPRDFYDDMKEYVREEDADKYNSIINSMLAFVERHGKFTITMLQRLNDDEVVKDTINTAYKFFTNGYIFVTAEKALFHPYDSLVGLVLQSDVQDRHFVKPTIELEETKFVKFLELATRLGERKAYLMPIIGYLAHRYKDETMAYIILLTEETENPEDGGGAGKNVFCSLLKWTTTFKNIPASQSKLDERFLQPWNGERVLCLSDLPKHFDFLFLKELSSGDGLLKKLFLDQITVPVHKMPKIIAQTNYSYENLDGGLKRRILPIEFTNYFTLSGGVDVTFGCHFPNGWDEDDWAGYDLFMCHCMQLWLQSGKLKPATLSSGGWNKQFTNTHGDMTMQFIQENIGDWCKVGEVVSSDFVACYDKFCVDNAINIKFKKSMQYLIKAVTDYCSRNNIMFENNKVRYANGVSRKVKLFGSGAATLTEDLPF